MLCKMGLPVGPFTVHLAAIKSLMDETHRSSTIHWTVVREVEI